MPVEIEVPTEHLHETIHEAHHEAHGAAHGGEHGHGQHAGFTLGVALSSAMLAVLAALAALFAGHFANDAMIERIQAGDQWAYYQAKGIKSNVLRSKMETLAALGKPTDPKTDEKLAQYDAEQGEIQAEAFKLTDESEAHLTQHTRLAGSVTFFQIAIALGAIAVLTRKRTLWLVSLVVGVIGSGAMAYGFMRPAEREHAITKGAKAHEGEPPAAEKPAAKPETAPAEAH